MIKAILLDFSGTLIDDWDEVYETTRILAGRKGIKLTKEFYKKEYKIDWRKFWRSLGVNPDRKLNEEWGKIIAHLIDKKKKSSFYKGAINFLDGIKKKYRIAIVTSMIRSVFNKYVKTEKISEDYIDIIVTGDETGGLKPKPNQVLMACERLSIKPSEAVFIGDTEADIISGKKAGCKTIEVCWGYPRRDYERERGDFLAYSWKDVKKILFNISN